MINEWDFDMPKDNRFHDPFPDKKPEPPSQPSFLEEARLLLERTNPAIDGQQWPKLKDEIEDFLKRSGIKPGIFDSAQSVASKWALAKVDALNFTPGSQLRFEIAQALDAAAEEEWKRTARFAYRLIITCTDNDGCPDVSEDEFVKRVLDKLGRG